MTDKTDTVAKARALAAAFDEISRQIGDIVRAEGPRPYDEDYFWSETRRALQKRRDGFAAKAFWDGDDAAAVILRGYPDAADAAVEAEAGQQGADIRRTLDDERYHLVGEASQDKRGAIRIYTDRVTGEDFAVVSSPDSGTFDPPSVVAGVLTALEWSANVILSAPSEDKRWAGPALPEWAKR